MEFLYEWTENLVHYVLLFSLTMHLISKETYQPYMRFFMGLLLILLVLSPLFQIKKWEVEFEKYYREAIKQKDELDDYVADWSTTIDDSNSVEEDNGND